MESKAKEKIVILGRTGFVGQYLYNKLQDEAELEVYGFSSLSCSSKRYFWSNKKSCY